MELRNARKQLEQAEYEADYAEHMVGQATKYVENLERGKRLLKRNVTKLL